MRRAMMAITAVGALAGCGARSLSPDASASGTAGTSGGAGTTGNGGSSGGSGASGHGGASGGGGATGGAGGESTCSATCATVIGTDDRFATPQDAADALAGRWQICAGGDGTFFGAPADTTGVEFGPASTTPYSSEPSGNMYY